MQDNFSLRVVYHLVDRKTNQIGKRQTKNFLLRPRGWVFKTLWLGYLQNHPYEETPTQSYVEHRLDICHRLLSEPLENLTTSESPMVKIMARRCGRWLAEDNLRRGFVKTKEEVCKHFGMLYQAWKFGREFKEYSLLNPASSTFWFYQNFDREAFKTDKRMDWFLQGYQQVIVLEKLCSEEVPKPQSKIVMFENRRENAVRNY